MKVKKNYWGETEKIRWGKGISQGARVRKKKKEPGRVILEVISLKEFLR